MVILKYVGTEDYVCPDLEVELTLRDVDEEDGVSAEDAFYALYKFWTNMTFTEEQFAKMCKRYVINGQLMFYK